MHAVRAWSYRHAGSTHKAILKLDLRNAFNCVSREEVLRQATAHFPSLARWATWCYRQPSRLQFSERALESSAGVQQGDPLGPLLFSLALQPLASELRGGSVDLAVHYLDDGVLAGDIPALGAALQLAQRRAADIGLELNLGKVRVGSAEQPQRFAPAGRTSRMPCCSDRMAAAGFSLTTLSFWAQPIGDDAFIGEHTAKRAAQAGEPVAELEDPQVGLRLLRACAGFSRMVHSMRCNPPCAQATALATFDGLVQRCFGDLTWHPPECGPMAPGCTRCGPSRPWVALLPHPCAGCLLGIAGGEPCCLCRPRLRLLGPLLFGRRLL